MSKVVVTSYTDNPSLKVDFGIYGAAFSSPQWYNRKFIMNVRCITENDNVTLVELLMKYDRAAKIFPITHNQSYDGSFNATPVMIVDSIDGTAPTSREHLAEMVAKLMM
jgi:hypothetical protein